MTFAIHVARSWLSPRALIAAIHSYWFDRAFITKDDSFAPIDPVIALSRFTVLLPETQIRRVQLGIHLVLRIRCLHVKSSFDVAEDSSWA